MPSGDAHRSLARALDILELIPYGDAALRICCFPIGAIKEDKQKEMK